MLPANPIVNSPPITKPAGRTGSQATLQEGAIAAFKFEVGQQIVASIQAEVSPGVYQAQIAGQSVQMQLPGLIKVGSQITLQVVAVTPRVTFGVLSPEAPLSTAEEISTTSRLLADLTRQPLTKTFVESASGRAVWPSPAAAPETAKLAVALKDALAGTGLFYESHQAQWIAGTRTTAQLLNEPQNQLPRQIPTNMSDGAERQPLTTKPESVASPGIPTTTDKPSAPGSSGNFPIAKELIPLVQQQLHALETHQLVWSGQVWPNQQMQWEIQGEPEHRASRPDERQWKTEMQLLLPRLGDVKASLSFHQGAVRLSLHAGNAEVRPLLDRHLPELASSMKSAGIPLTSATVEKS